MFEGRKIILGVTGSIAAYKAVEILRLLVRGGAEVTTIMTRNATQFVAPLTFDVLSGRPCLVDQYEAEGLKNSFIPPDDPDRAPIVHIDLAQRADCLLVAPASANVIGKVAHGIADDLLSVTIMATTAPVIFAPAMNTHMWQNPIVLENVERLRLLGYHFLGPSEGDLACGIGPGRLLEPEEVVEGVRQILEAPAGAGAPARGASVRGSPLSGKTVLISAGRTEEPIDPVRTIANRSSGRMGYALARAARARGARVLLVTGPANVEPPPGVELCRVQTAADMHRALVERLPQADCLIMAAAVADYRPKSVASDKIRRDGGLTLELEPTTDILAAVAARKGKRLHVGFALETGDQALDSARRKLHDKHLDLMVLNRADEPGAGLDVETNRVVLIGAEEEKALPLMHKDEVARQVLDEVVRLMRAQATDPGGGVR
jgi:phosphopantothenoylcysteine decarboxylase/phosphopantothenate--cysteine ligase